VVITKCGKCVKLGSNPAVVKKDFGPQQVCSLIIESKGKGLSRIKKHNHFTKSPGGLPCNQHLTY
jgi:hypothetical protein